MKTLLSLGITAVVWAGLTGCSVTSPQKQDYKAQVQQFFQNYQTLKPNKAMAYTKGDNGQYVFGQAFEYTSQEGAKIRALKQCNDRRLALNVAEKCELLAVGNSFLKELKFK